MRSRFLALAAPAIAALACAAPAAACVTVGVYQDNPAASLPALTKSVGAGISVISTYLTAGQPLAQSVIETANREHAGVLVTWQPDSGRESAVQPGYRLKDVARGRYDASLKALVVQLHGVRRGAILRPMPEMNTPWYAWSGTVNGNNAAEYVKAWDRVRRAVRSAPGGAKIKLLWAPYAWSIPNTTANELEAYFPGASEVDLVGASGYNFGNEGATQLDRAGGSVRVGVPADRVTHRQAVLVRGDGFDGNRGRRGASGFRRSGRFRRRRCPNSPGSSGTTSTTPPVTSSCVAGRSRERSGHC